MLRKICGGFSTLILIVLAALAACMIIPYMLGMKTMAVLTGSMEPAYPVGSLIYVKPVEPEQLEIGDVVTYRLTGNTVVTHRVAAIDRDRQSITTKGDANEQPDGSPVPYTSIVGRARMCIPYLGFISIYAKTPIGIMAVCGVLIVIILLTFLPEIFSSEEEEAAKAKKKKAEA